MSNSTRFVGSSASLAEAILARLERVKGPDPQGNYKSLCPYHAESEPSFQFHPEKGCYFCFGCGAKGSTRRLAEHFGLETGPLTVEQLAGEKSLPLEWLTKLCRQGKGGIEIPYLDTEGREVAVRTRMNLTDTETASRFRWRRGDHPILYGLFGVEAQQGKGYTVLVEGESDTWTLWFSGFPGLGVPGASTWKKEWAAHLAGFGKVYLWVGPDSGGQTLLKAVSADVPNLLVICPPSGVKDASEFYLRNPEQFKAEMEKLLLTARPASELLAELADVEFKANLELARPLLENPMVLPLIMTAGESLGVVQERKNLTLLYLAIVSRILPRPVNVKVYGPSSGGKSVVAETVIELHCPEAVYCLTSGSERALVFTDEDFAHRFIFFQEARGAHPGDVAQAILHEIIWGNRVRYMVTEKDKDGHLASRLIEKPGPTGILLTSTQLLPPELETRLLTITVKDTPDQNRAVLSAIAAQHNGHHPQGVDLSRFHALSRVLARPVRVTVPWGNWLAKKLPDTAVSMRRAFALFLSLVESCAILHQAHRPRTSEGIIIANVADYAIIRLLAGDALLAPALGGITPGQRAAIEAVKAICLDQQGQGEVMGASLPQVAQKLGIGKEAARQRLLVPLAHGFVTNSESRKGYPARYIPGLALEDVSPLPTAEELLGAFPELTGKWRDILDFLEGASILNLDTLTVPPARYEPRYEGGVMIADLDTLTVPPCPGPQSGAQGGCQGGVKVGHLDGSPDRASNMKMGGCQGVKAGDIPSSSAPACPCPACGGTAWWWRPDGTGPVCGVCHPQPGGAR